MRDLDAGSNGPGSSCALAVNDSGTVAGRSTAGMLAIWNGSSVTSLNVAGDVGGIDSRGVVVGSYRDGASTIAFRYADGALKAIAGPNSVATGINSRGQVAGTVDGRAFIYESGALRDLGTLGGARSSAKGLNDLGQVVGMSSDANSQPRAFEFDGAMRALPGPSYAGAIGINNRGQVVGSAEGTHGYLVEGDAYTRLDTLGAVTARGWRHMEPTGINDRGWIVGTGTNAAGELRAFILVPARGESRR
jgi:probable HAF family extracellular repeat protein